MSSFGEKLKAYRSAMGYSQDQLAEIVDTSKQVISRYESQQRVPKLTVAQTYADALHLPLVFLIDNSISFQEWEHESLLEDYWNANSNDRILLVERRGIDPRIASDYAALIKERENSSRPVRTDEKTAAQVGDGLSPLDAQLMDFLHLLTDDQKRMLLAQIKTLLDLQG